MRNIRQSVFETNSSSMHSLSVIGSDRMRSIFSEDIEVSYGEFGWGYEELSEPIEKISYLITEYKNNRDKIELIQKVVKDYTGSNLIIIGNSEDGYIDHQSWGTIQDYINNNNNLSEEDSIRDIIFNDKYTIIIDNDNY